MVFQGYKTMRFEYRGRVLRVILDGNGPMNPVDQDLHDELARVFAEVDRDPDSDVIVLTSENRAFCAGGDMEWFQEMIDRPEGFRAIAHEAKRIVFGLLEMEKPIVCRLNGAAAGLGATIALLCDIIVADEKALIGDPHVRMGIVAGDGGAVIWPQLIGFARAKEFLMTGDMIPASRAAEMGLVNYAVPTAELDAKTDEIVDKLAGGARWAIRWTKTVTNITLREIAHKLMDASLAYEMMTNLTADHQEAVSAFKEKRPPKFSGE